MEGFEDLLAQDFDYIVVGGGVAGNVVVNRLTDDPHASNLVLEVGESFVHSDFFFSFYTDCFQERWKSSTLRSLTFVLLWYLEHPDTGITLWLHN
ncbi:hypothetical protein DFS33DRAFT_780619 [Desarmillaria ectypa]|nr:hypothetical protein DFS33DRAFT_780619 [Desarmillaria ectypa]